MAQVELRLSDGELVLPVPHDVTEALSLREGLQVSVTFTSGNAVIAEKRPDIPRYNLDELLDEWQQVSEEERDYREWVDAPRVGRELI